MTLRPCPSCHRHVRTTEPVCAFCGRELGEAASPPRVNPVGALTRAAVLFAGGTLVNCSVNAVPPDGVAVQQGAPRGSLSQPSLDAGVPPAPKLQAVPPYGVFVRREPVPELRARTLSASAPELEAALGRVHHARVTVNLVIAPDGSVKAATTSLSQSEGAALVKVLERLRFAPDASEANLSFVLKVGDSLTIEHE